MNYKYLIFSTGGMIWGKHELTKEYFVNAVQRRDLIVNTEADTYFDEETNSWKEISGDDEDREAVAA